MLFSQRIQLVREFHEWAQNANKDIRGGQVNENDFGTFLAFLEIKGLIKEKEKETIGRKIEIKGEIYSSKWVKELCACFNQNFLWDSNMTKEETSKELDRALQTIKETVLSCLY